MLRDGLFTKGHTGSPLQDRRAAGTPVHPLFGTNRRYKGHGAVKRMRGLWLRVSDNDADPCLVPIGWKANRIFAARRPDDGRRCSAPP